VQDYQAGIRLGFPGLTDNINNFVVNNNVINIIGYASGIRLTNVKNTIVSNNYIKSGYFYGINLVESDSLLLISEIRIVGGTISILISNQSYKNFVFGNYISQITDNGISTVRLNLNSSGNLVGNCNINIDGLMSTKTYSQPDEPPTTINNSFYFWIDTDDGNKLYFCFNQNGITKKILLN
jgi:hypothetical protein